MPKMDWLSIRCINLVNEYRLFIILSINYYLILGMQTYFALIITLVILILIVILKSKADKQLYPWDRMIGVEHRHYTNYYKFVNMFTDVKHLRESAVRRSYLDFILPVPKGKSLMQIKCIYIYLYEVLYEVEMLSASY